MPGYWMSMELEGTEGNILDKDEWWMRIVLVVM